MSTYSWTWPIAEIVHFIGLILLVGSIGLIDLRVLGVARSLPLAPLHRLVPWGIAGFVMCLATGLLFVSGDSFKDVISDWKAQTITLGRRVKVQTTRNTYEGLAVDIDWDGGLIVELADGKRQKIIYGDCFHQDG